jgi:hypothetical protein
MNALGERSVATMIRLVLDAAWWAGVVALALLSGLLVLSFFVNLEGRSLTMDIPGPGTGGSGAGEPIAR